MRVHPPQIPAGPLPGRAEPIAGVPQTHAVLGTPLHGPWGEHTRLMYLAMGCFWGAERLFWRLPGVVSTAAGYMGGVTPNPTYEEVCSGRTGHAEAVQVVYDEREATPEDMLRVFWENHDPTTLDRQGNDVGTQYRSAVYWTTEEQERWVRATHDAFQQVLHEHGHGDIATELRPATEAGRFYYAEGYHQQYLHTNPFGYCNHGPTGMTCPVGVLRQDQLPSQQELRPPVSG
ncbi:peptide-methionine (S)-S-oxide reductase MsrA [Ornithinicoccus halotolerans]|uniref:peptide-methionine (S)-S-oxide reductase MsrA n=1 Tax=Ornithinicoccus halotolerans TaxID=1748220 RepID=UPI001297DDC2|nr:peptide-methionine (S)-S-oxide reductase MsrA [Ornithinicoccus halotolerans]